MLTCKIANRALRLLCLSTSLVLACAGAARAQTTSFTYQGRLTDGGTPANGTYEIQFTLWDATAGGTQQPQPAPVVVTRANVQVSAGAFTVQPLDFGANGFPGADRYLEISVRRNALDPFTTLSPRQQITSTPYAIRSLTAATADTATNATQLGSVDAARFVQADGGGNVNVAGGLTVGGSFSLNIVNAQTQYNLSGQRMLTATLANSSTSLGVNSGSSASGSSNTFLGAFAGETNATGGQNTFVGAAAGHANTSGSANAFFGARSGFSNTANANAFFGAISGQNNTTGSGNSFLGFAAGGSNTTGDFNSFFGAQTGFGNTTGKENSFFGDGAGAGNVTASFNTFVGRQAGLSNAGNGNSFFGHLAGQANTNGASNAFFGLAAGISNTTGTGNTIIGTNANVGLPGLTNANAIGANALVSTGNSMVLGGISGVNGAVADTNVGIGTTSPMTRLHVVGSSWFQGDNTPLPASAGKGIVMGFSGELGYISSFDYGTFTPKTLLLNNSGGNVGIGTNTPNSTLTVAGAIETTTGGVKFPDGSIQTTAAGVGSITGVTAGTGLSGGGTVGNVTVSIANLGVTTTLLANSAVTAPKIAGGQVVKSLNGLNDSVTLAAGANITITPVGNTLTIASTSGGSGILNQTTLQASANFNIDGTGAANVLDSATHYYLQGQRFMSTNSELANTLVGLGAGENIANDLISSRTNNSFFGYNAGLKNANKLNSFFGGSAGVNNVSGSANVFVGYGAGFSNASGENNTFIGTLAGLGNTNEAENTAIGYSSSGAAGITNATSIGARAQVTQSNSVVLGSINGLNGASADTNVGIGTTAPKAKLEVTGGNILVGTAGQGIILKSPDGATCKLLSIDNAGAVALSTVACP